MIVCLIYIIIVIVKFVIFIIFSYILWNISLSDHSAVKSGRPLEGRI